MTPEKKNGEKKERKKVVQRPTSNEAHNALLDAK
jgi:hypothetical protein